MSESLCRGIKDDYKRIFNGGTAKSDLERQVVKENILFSDELTGKSNIELTNVDESDINLKELLKNQIEENKKFREMLSKFIDHKNKNVFIGNFFNPNQFAILEDMQKEKPKRESSERSRSKSCFSEKWEISENDANIIELQNKCKKYRVYYKLFKHS